MIHHKYIHQFNLLLFHLMNFSVFINPLPSFSTKAIICTTTCFSKSISSSLLFSAWLGFCTEAHNRDYSSYLWSLLTKSPSKYRLSKEPFPSRLTTHIATILFTCVSLSTGDWMHNKYATILSFIKVQSPSLFFFSFFLTRQDFCRSILLLRFKGDRSLSLSFFLWRRKWTNSSDERVFVFS